MVNVTVTADVTITHSAGAVDTVPCLSSNSDATGGWVATLDTGDFEDAPVFENTANKENASLWRSDEMENAHRYGSTNPIPPVIAGLRSADHHAAGYRVRRRDAGQGSSLRARRSEGQSST